MRLRAGTASPISVGLTAALVILATVGTAAAQSWTTQNSGTTQLLEGIRFTTPLNGWIVGDAGTTRSTIDGGATWIAVPLTAGDLGDVAFRDDASVGLIVGDNGQVFRSVGGGAWTPVTSGTSANLSGLAFGGTGLAHASGRDGTILRSTDDGATWSVAETGTARYRGAAAQSMSAWHVGDAAVIRATTDGGANWLDQNAGTTNDLRGAHFVSTTEGWIAGSNSTLLYTNNGGATWTPRNTGITGGLNGVFFVDSMRGWAVGDLGAIFATTNGGLGWLPEASGTVQPLNDVFFLSAALGWAVGDQGTLLVRDNATGVDEIAAEAAGLRLGSAPNPFAVSTSIRYTLPGPREGRVVLRVYDAAGRTIRALRDADEGPGAYATTWDGRDDAGVPVVSGVYFYRLSWNGSARTGRVVLLR